MFIAILRVEIVLDVIWSSVLMLASWAKTKSPPTRGHLNGSGRAAPAAQANKASNARRPNFIRSVPRDERFIPPQACAAWDGAWRGPSGASSPIIQAVQA